MMNRYATAATALVFACALPLASCGETADARAAGPAGEIVMVSQIDGDFEILHYSFADSTSTNLSQSPGLDYVPTWSPDGSEILFYSDRAGNWDVHIMNADGSNVRNLTNHPARDMNASVGPGGLIAFVSDRDGDREIMVMGPDGSDVRALTSNDWMDDMPAWSPDGRHIVYASSQNSEDTEIHVLDVETGTDRLLVAKPGFDSSPAWSPDGSLIAFYGAHGDSIGIFLVSSDGTDLRRLPPGSADERHARWAPDGEWLLITSASGDNANPDTDVWVVRPDGTDRRRVTLDPGRQEYATWKPAGRR